MTKIIAIANQKGGVGKTTTTMNLGAALSIMGKKVLLIDIDPQANLSEYLGYSEPDEKPTMTQLILTVCSRSVIDHDLVKGSIRHNDVNDVDYIPSDINLANADVAMSAALSRETVLKRILSKEVVSEYDYVLIDCLPALGVLLINAMTAATDMIIPVQTQKFSVDGLTALTALHSQITATINSELSQPFVLPTMVDNTKVSKNALTKLSERFMGTLLSTVIHKSVEAAKSSESGIALCKTKNRLGDEYKSLANEIIGRGV